MLVAVSQRDVSDHMNGDEHEDEHEHEHEYEDEQKNAHVNKDFARAGQQSLAQIEMFEQMQMQMQL
jgi:hypothetical protein